MNRNDFNLHLFCSKCNSEVPFTLEPIQTNSITTTCPSCQTVNIFPIIYIGKSSPTVILNRINTALKTNNYLILSALGDKNLILLHCLLFLKNSHHIDSFGLYRITDGILRCVCLVKSKNGKKKNNR